MPVKAAVGSERMQWLRPTAAWKTVAARVSATDSLAVDPDFYVLARNANAPPPPPVKPEALWYSTSSEPSTRSFLANAGQISIVSPQVFSYDNLGGIHGQVDP